MKIIVKDEYDGMTVFELVRRKIGISTKLLNALKQKEDGILVNGKRVTVRYILSHGDILQLNTAVDTKPSENIPPTPLPLEIIYEDLDIILLNKPYAMPTHPSRGHFTDTLANALAYYYEQKGVPFVFRAISRLDRNTSGLVLVAKNKLSAARLSDFTLKRQIERQYIAVLSGNISDSLANQTDFFSIKSYIKRAPDSTMLRISSETPEGGQFAHTKYRVAAANDKYSIVHAFPHTGRTHQLRVHFASVGHPIVGDELYSGDISLFSRQALHAHCMKFTHPTSGKTVEFCAPLPKDILKLIRSVFCTR